MGLVHVDSALSVAPCIAGWAGVRRDGNDDSAGRVEPVRDVSGIHQFRLGGRSPGQAQSSFSLYVNGISSDSTLRCGAIGRNAAGARSFGRIFRDGNLFGLRDRGQRDLPDCCSGASAWRHLQRSACIEFSGSAGDWARGADEGIGLGFLFMRGGIFAGGADDDAVAGDEGKAAGIDGYCSPGVTKSSRRSGDPFSSRYSRPSQKLALSRVHTRHHTNSCSSQ